MKKILNPLTLLLITFPKNTFCFCPVYSLAVGAGAGLAHWIGIDDTISGLWIGAFTMSLVMWTINFLNQKNIRFLFRKILVTTAYYFFVIFPLYKANLISIPTNKIWGYDKLLLGIITGSIIFLAINLIYKEIRKKYNSPIFFGGEKIIFSLTVLTVLSGIFYLITK